MYADDDQDDAYLFHTVMSDIVPPCDSSVFSSGIDLIRHLETPNDKPDIIMMDINMPLKNGLECLREIRQNKQWDTIPVYIFSTSDAELYQRQALNYGASGYVHKPSSFQELRDAIKNLIESAEEQIRA